MNQYKHFFGVDVSKNTIDISYYCSDKEQIIHRQFANQSDGMNEMTQWFVDLSIEIREALFCMEETGLYCFTLTNYLLKNGIDTWVEHALNIKRSIALSRGKNDKVDSKRIAQYAATHTDRLRLWKPMNATLEKIKHLAALRDRIVETQKRLLVPIKEFEAVGNTEMVKLIRNSIKTTIAALDKDLKNIESKIIDIVNSDDHLLQLYKVVVSVVGIGFVTGINLIVHTQAFTIMNDSRKLACYCGVAPFEYSSGSSIRGKTKVHPMANKKLKCNLHMAALSAVRTDADLKKYYERKVEEGKNKMSVLNAVRNKILNRVVACVNKNKEYVKVPA